MENQPNEQEIEPKKRSTDKPLFESERAAQMILDLLPDVVIITGEAGNIMHSNAQIEKMFGYQFAELSGRSIETILPKLHGQDLLHQADYMSEYRHNTIGQEVGLYGKRKDGSEFPVEIQLIPIKSVVNCDVLVIVTDTTGSSIKENEFHQMIGELKQYIDTLETTNRELGAFTYSITHDLKSPLRGIFSYIDILTEDYGHLLDAEGKDVCKVISDEAHRMSKLLDGLTMFSQLGRSEIRMSVIDMKAVANQVFDELTRTHSHKNIDFRLSELPFANGDSLLMYQMWNNLLSNAIKFTSKKEEPLIEISAVKTDGKTTYIIRDNGAGFDMKNAGKLFGIFERLHGEREFEGTGTGLAIVNRIVQRHGGIIRAEAERGKGAAFFITLPAMQEQ